MDLQDLQLPSHREQAAWEANPRTYLCEESCGAVLKLRDPIVPTQGREERTEVRKPSVGQWAWITAEGQPLWQPE